MDHTEDNSPEEGSRPTSAGVMPWITIIAIWLSIAAALTGIAAFAPAFFVDGSSGTVTALIAFLCGVLATRHIAAVR